MSIRVRRRRFITITAAALGMPLLPVARGNAGATSQLRVWRGAALGADAVLQIHHPDPAAADQLILRSLAEVARLERVFSLYREDSALVRLNREGRLDDPPLDLVRLLGEAERFSALTGGAFDITVQPLWDVYASHFARPDADPSGPPHDVIADALSRTGHAGVSFDERQAQLRPGMEVTLNGIAQGYVTDRVVDLLRASGIGHALVDMGETRAIGGHPLGGPWSAGLEDPAHPGQVAERIALLDRAVATSGGYGTQFDEAGRFNHIFDPGDGSTSWRYLSVSVVAATATMADALSTAFTLMPLERTAPVVRALGLSAHFAMRDGSRVLQTN